MTPGPGTSACCEHRKEKKEKKKILGIRMKSTQKKVELRGDERFETMDSATFFFFSFGLFWAALTACGGSQARGQI